MMYTRKTHNVVTRVLTGNTQSTNSVHTQKDENTSIIIDQLAKKDAQISKLQESLDQSQATSYDRKEIRSGTSEANRDESEIILAEADISF